MLIKHIEHTNPLEKCLSGLSCYQYYVFFFVFLSKAPLFWHILNLIFLSPPMDFQCNGSKNHCPCDNPEWDTSTFTKTMQTKFGIYCDRTWLLSFAHSMGFFGALLGSFMFGFFSDKCGRLIAYAVACLIVAVAGCLIAVMPSAIPFIVMRLIEGIGVGGGIVTSYVLCIEYCSTEYREILSALFHIPLNFGHITIPGISYLLRDMDHFQLALSIPMFFFAALKFLIRESPKWLMDNGHLDELTDGLKKICPKTENIRNEIEEYIASRDQGQPKVQFLHIFKYKSLTINFICMAVNYFVCGMGYYGVSQFIGGMAGDIHVNVAISGLMVLPGTILCVFLLGLLSRRTFLMATNTLAGIFIIAVVCIPKTGWPRVVCACFSNCFFFVSFIIVFLYGVELFPTSVRNSVLGILSVLARIGQTLVPPINSLSQTFAGATFGVMAIIGAIMCLPLPETKNIALPSSLEDTNIINQNKKFSIPTVITHLTEKDTGTSSKDKSTK